jgi:hypothetical protein
MIEEHAEKWRVGLTAGTKDGFEGRLHLIKNELVGKREWALR